MHGSEERRSLERQNRELAILNAIANALNASVDLSTSLGAVLSRVADLLDLRAGWIWLLDESSGEPYLAAARNLPPGLDRYPERMEGTCYCLDAFRMGDFEGAENIGVVLCSRLRWLTDGTEGLRYHASIPLHARGKRLGVMNVATSEWRRLSGEELQILHTVGEMLGTAVERARLFARSQEAGAVEERNRLAREIHDTLAQGLAATAMQLETADALLDAAVDAERARAAVRQALKTTRENLEEARRSVLDLRATPLQGRSLADALEALCAATRKPGETEIRYRHVGAAQPLPSRIEVGLYRIAQEAIANALRHAGASRIDVRLECTPDQVVLTVTDDGRGFDADGTPVGRFGITGMRERARLLGGELLLEASLGTGTRVRVSIPVP